MIRQADVKDEIEKIYNIVFNKDILPFMPYSDITIEQFRIELEKRLHKTFVYEKNAEIIGVIELKRGENKQTHVGHIAVFAIHPNFQNKGIGTEMMKYLLEIVHAYGIQKLYLNVVSDNNKAISFYKKFGFNIEGYLKKQIKDDNLYKDLVVLSLFLE